MNTPILGWEFPNDNEDPWFEKITSFYEEIESTLYAQINATSIIIPAPTMSWNNVSRVFSWTGSFEIPIFRTGFSCFIDFGPDGINKSAQVLDGQRLVAVIPYTASQNISVNFQVQSGIFPYEKGMKTFGFCRGSTFYANLPVAFL